MFLNEDNFQETLKITIPSELSVDANNFVDYPEIGKRARQQLNSFVTLTTDLKGHKNYHGAHFVAVTMDETQTQWDEVNCSPPGT